MWTRNIFCNDVRGVEKRSCRVALAWELMNVSRVRVRGRSKGSVRVGIETRGDGGVKGVRERSLGDTLG